MSQTFFITGSGTGVGKTLVTAALAYQLRKAGTGVSALKPVVSGYAPSDMESDTAIILQSLGQAVNPVTIAAVSPWKFSAPLASNIAAAAEGKKIVFSEVVDFCNVTRTSDITLIEAAGGAMSPLTDTHTMLDLAVALQCPVILVVGTYLGAISHALTAGEVLKARGIPVQAVIVSESETSAIDALGTAGEFKKFFPGAKHIVPLPRIGGGGERLWEHAADLTWVLS